MELLNSVMFSSPARLPRLSSMLGKRSAALARLSMLAYSSEVVRLALAARLRGDSLNTEARKLKADGMSVTARMFCQWPDVINWHTELARAWLVVLRGADSG